MHNSIACPENVESDVGMAVYGFAADANFSTGRQHTQESWFERSNWSGTSMSEGQSQSSTRGRQRSQLLANTDRMNIV